MIFQSLAVCFVPLLVIFALFYLFVPELKLSSAILSVLAGFLAILPVGALNIYVFPFLGFTSDTLSAVLLQDLVLNGFVEELFKMLFILMLIPKTDDFRAFFFCSLLAGLSVGCFELLVYYPSWSENIHLKLILRTCTAVMLHAFCAGLSGIFVFSVWKKLRQPLAFIFAVVFHGVYNYFAGFRLNVPFFYFSFIVLFFAAIECRIRFVRLKDKLLKR